MDVPQVINPLQGSLLFPTFGNYEKAAQVLVLRMYSPIIWIISTNTFWGSYKRVIGFLVHCGTVFWGALLLRIPTWRKWEILLTFVTFTRFSTSVLIQCCCSNLQLLVAYDIIVEHLFIQFLAYCICSSVKYLITTLVHFKSRSAWLQNTDSFLKYYFIFIFTLYVWFFYLHVCKHHVHAVPAEARQGIPWNWRQLLLTVLVLETKAGSSARESVNSCNWQAVAPAFLWSI